MDADEVRSLGKPPPYPADREGVDYKATWTQTLACHQGTAVECNRCG
jgi:hypothetical protein